MSRSPDLCSKYIALGQGRGFGFAADEESVFFINVLSTHIRGTRPPCEKVFQGDCCIHTDPPRTFPKLLAQNFLLNVFGRPGPGLIAD